MSSIQLSALYADWTLIIFTVFAQFSAGTALFASLAQHDNQAPLAQKLWKIAFGLVCIAGIVSMLHLQNPLNAFYTLTQVGNSWLSREIAVVGIFAGLIFVQLIKTHKGLGYLASFMGFVLVYVISKVYSSVASMPFWSNMGTVIGYYGTYFMLGSAAYLWAQTTIKTCEEKTCLKNCALVAIILGIVLSLASKLSWITVFMQGNTLEVPATFTLSLCHLALQVIFIILGLVTVTLQKVRNSPTIIGLGLLCFVFAELAGRTVFFLAQLKLGV